MSYRDLFQYNPSRQSLVLEAVRRTYAYCEISVGLKDVLEEAASIVVILRLWRVFKIVEEFSAGASDRQYILDLYTLHLYQTSGPLEWMREKDNSFSYCIIPLKYC